MSMYETIFITEPGLPEPDADALAETFQNVLTEGDGSIKKSEGWGKKKLAYAVRKHEEGYYYHLRYDAPADAVMELERRLRNHEQVLKYLSVRLTREALQAVEVAEQKAAEKAAARAAREAERAARQAEAVAAAVEAGVPVPGTPAEGSPEAPAAASPEAPAAVSPKTPAAVSPETPAAASPETPAAASPETPAVAPPEPVASPQAEEPAPAAESSEDKPKSEDS